MRPVLFGLDKDSSLYRLNFYNRNEGATLEEAGAEELESKKARAFSVADEIVNMRSSLAKTFIMPDTEITEETFKNVCGAVAKRAKEIGEKEGFRIRHSAVKNRNPNFAANPGEAKVLEEFDKDRNLGYSRDKRGKVSPVYEAHFCGGGMPRMSRSEGKEAEVHS